MKTYTEKELRELDGWIAEHVMGWKLCGHMPSYWKQKGSDEIWFLCEVGSEDKFPEWCPTESRDQSLSVLEKCHEQCCVETGMFENVSGTKRGYFAMSVYKDITVEAETLPLAIALFAKKLFSK